MQPHRQQPTRLPRPWDSPGKNTGVGCHFLLQCMKVKSESEVAQSCPTLSDPMDWSLTGSSVQRIFQARVLEWGVIAFNTQKICPFHYRGLKCKSRKSRNTWSNRQIWPWNMEWSRAKINSFLPRKCTGHNKHPLPTTQEKTLYMTITRWSTPESDWLYSLQPKMEKLCTVNKNKTRSWLWLRSWNPYYQIQT